ncbi:TAXI family TRAP transporter solute-binding subunit [Pseudonocardia sp.]|uniref:TAXI family TRAP transporter solute-binding subunit n=1 Tax=Pseudonocardia sp. TaxID=60912 RepID=UPI003D138D25
MPLPRRALLAAIGAGLLAGCAAPFADTRLRIATGGTQGVYFALGTALAQAWQSRLELSARPAVLATAGSVENLALLASGAADVVFSQVDTVADRLAGSGTTGLTAPRGLARIYDDVVHVVVPATSPARSVTDLRGMRVSVGAKNSGVRMIARRLLTAAGLRPDTDVRAQALGINESASALQAGGIDAFFWSGGVPTAGVSGLAQAVPIRLLDLEDLLPAVQARYPEYAPGTVAAGTYGIADPVTTFLVRNVLLVPAGMPDALAEALVSVLFGEQVALARASAAALRIDTRAAIGTQPVPLHPGAERFYRAAKTG